MSDDKEYGSVTEALNDIHDDDDLGVPEEDRDPEDQAVGEFVDGMSGDDEDEGEEAQSEDSDDEDGETELAASEDGEGEEGEAQAHPDEDEEDDVFDTITPEQLAEIRANPALNQLRKSLMRGWQKKSESMGQLAQLAEAFRDDPQGVAQAIAMSVGLQVAGPGGGQPAPQAPVAQPGQPDPELVDLFGPEIAARIDGVLAKKTAPVQQFLTQQRQSAFQNELKTAEATWKARNKGVLTPEIEKEVVKLGMSGRIVPGNLPPDQYLDTLLEVALARQGPQRRGGESSKRLAQRIQKNRSDREPRGTGRVERGKSTRIKPEMGISAALEAAADELGGLE